MNSIPKNTEFDYIKNGFRVLSPIKMPSKTIENKEDIKAKTTSAPTTQTESTKSAHLTQIKDTVEIKSQETKQRKPLGKIVFYSMCAVGAVALLLTKGLSGATAGKIRRLADKWENNFLKMACKNKSASMVDDGVVRISQKTNKLFKLSDGIANFTAIKDTLFHEFTSWNFVNNKSNNKFLKHLKFPKLQAFLRKWVPLQKFFDFCTRNVLKISVSAVDTKYEKAGSAIEALEAKLVDTIKDKKIPTEKKEKIYQLIDLISPTYRDGFSKKVRNQRLSYIHTSLANLAQDVKEQLCRPFSSQRKGSSEVYSSYITKKLSTPAQEVHKSAISKAKIAFSNDITDVYSNLRNTANELKHHFAPQDKEARLLLGEIFENIEKYSLLSGNTEKTARTTVMQNILLTLQKIEEQQKLSSESQKITALIGDMKNTISNSSKKGLLQEILTEVKDVLPQKEYKGLKLQTKEVNELLNEAIDKESNNLFDKIAESKVGSIPTDMVGLGMMAGTGAWAISKGKDKEEKIGATLKVGIPLLGGIGSYFYTASKAFSGVKNLAFGALTAYLLNKAGSTVFDYYKKRYVEKKTVAEIAQDVYDNTVKA